MSHTYLHVHNLPQEVEERELKGSTVIVVDLLRASSTICQALAAGASEVVPFLEIDDALAAAESIGRSQIILGGERSGGKIPGFDLGNSPSEYTPKVVGGRRVFITTTNGTRALFHARLANRVLIGAFVNLSAVAKSIQDDERIDIVCAGTDGGETREDILAAGAIVSRLIEFRKGEFDANKAANEALREWEEVVARANAASRPIADQIAIELQDTQGGRNLLGIGLDQDLVDCAQSDCFNIVPEYDARNKRITLPRGGKRPR